MNDIILTPDMIAHELRAIRHQADEGPDHLKRAELRHAVAEDAYQAAYDEAYSDAPGTVADREIAARSGASALKPVVNEEKAELNRVKAKMRALDSAQMGLQSQLKAVLITYTEAGR
jgi:hypothetical protein